MQWTNNPENMPLPQECWDYQPILHAKYPEEDLAERESVEWQTCDACLNFGQGHCGIYTECKSTILND